MATFGTILKELRKKANIKQSELADMLNLDRTTITKWENDKSTTNNEMLTALSKIFNVSTDFLLGNSEQYKLPENAFTPKKMHSFRVIGNVAAGYDGVAVEEYTGECMPVPEELFHGLNEKDFFVLQIKGDSMQPKLFPGDKVLVQRRNSVDSGDVAIILYNGDECTVKKVMFEVGCDWIDLVPFNGKYQTKRIDGNDLNECEILGKVVYLFRSF